MNVKELKSFGDKLAALEAEWAKLKSEVDGSLQQMRFDFDQAAKNAKEDVSKAEDEPKTKKRAKVTEQSGNFPYAVGKIVQAAFPELFRRKLINAGDVAYLMSDRAVKDFKIKGKFSVLKTFVREDDPDLNRQGICRYYKSMRLVLGGKTYCLTNQFRPNSRAEVLKWISAHGLRRQELLDIMKNEM